MRNPLTMADVLRVATRAQREAIAEQGVTNPADFLPVVRDRDEDPPVLVGAMSRRGVLQPSQAERALVRSLTARPK